MQIILLEKVVKLGNLGDVIRVKDGFARNFLIPQRKARRATDAAIKEFEAKRAELEQIAAQKFAAAQVVGEKLTGAVLKLSQKAGVDGRLFGSVGSADIAAELAKQHATTIEKTQVRMPLGPIKTIGEYVISVVLHTDVVIDLNVVIVGETS
ncbi:MAG: 50S ribosomal protein L9 [Ottowia sp.]|nr:50S ribosomal protein L9 [Ottowia sp.]